MVSLKGIKGLVPVKNAVVTVMVIKWGTSGQILGKEMLNLTLGGIFF